MASTWRCQWGRKNVAVFVNNIPHVILLFILIHILVKLLSEADTPQQTMLRILFGIASRRRLHGCPDSSEMNGLVLPDFNIAGPCTALLLLWHPRDMHLKNCHTWWRNIMCCPRRQDFEQWIGCCPWYNFQGWWNRGLHQLKVTVLIFCCTPLCFSSTVFSYIQLHWVDPPHLPHRKQIGSSK